MPVVMKADNVREVLSDLRNVDRNVRNRTIRKATNAAGRVVLKETQRQVGAMRVTGYTRRSMKSVSKSKNGVTTVRIGQSKTKSFKVKKRRSGNLSQIQRAGKPVPIHWIERGTRAHKITPKNRVLAFQARKRTRGDSGMVFTRIVNHPGMRERRPLERAAKQSQSEAGRAFNNAAAEDLNNVRG